MYETFFGLNRAPFSMISDPDALFFTEGHREAFAGLSYAITRRKGFAVLEGEAGTGKTTLIRKLLQFLPETGAQVSLVLNPVLSADEFLELVLISLGLSDLPRSKTQRLLQLERLLCEANLAGRTPVLIIDEAHKLSNEVLEEIRLLTNFETAQAKLLQIVLIGQPELKEILNRPELWQLKQRIPVRLRIAPLTQAEARDYMEFRWRWAGSTETIPFTEDALHLIAASSQGIPRVINAICDSALLLAYGDRSRTVSAAAIREAVADLDLAPKIETTPSAANTNGNGHGNADQRSSLAVEVPHAASDECMPLRLEILDRYSAVERGSFGFHWGWRRKGLSARPVDNHEQNLQSVKTI
jgi:general secretion pathway protein A